jgi:hypothetical protein
MSSKWILSLTVFYQNRYAFLFSRIHDTCCSRIILVSSTCDVVCCYVHSILLGSLLSIVYCRTPQRNLKVLRCSAGFRNMLIYYDELLATRPTPKLEDYPFSTISDCLFILFATTMSRGRLLEPQLSVFITHYSTVVTICTTRFTIQQFYVLPTQRIYVFCVDLRTNSDYFTVQH